MTHSEKIFRNTIFSFGSKIVTIVLGFVTRKLFIVFLTEELMGLNALFADLLGLLNLADMGLGIAVQFNLYKPLADKDEEKLGRILNAARRIYNIIGVGMILAGIVLSFFIQFLIKENPYSLDFLRVVFIINVISSASSYFFVHKRLFMHASEDIHVTNVVDIVMNLLSSVLKIVAIVVFKNYYLFIAINVIQSFVSNFMIGYYCDKKYPYLNKVKGYSKDEMGSLLSNIKELVPNKISSFVYTNTDNTIISAFIGLASVTLFTNYTSIVTQIFMMAAMIAGVVKVSFGNVLQESTDKNQHMFFLNSYQMLQFFYSSFCGVALFCLLDEFVAFWYGEEFVIPLICVVLLTVDFYLHSMYQPLSMMLEVLGEFRPLKRQEIFAMIVNIIVSVALIQVVGLAGPILGTLAVDICTTIFRIYTVIYKHYRDYAKEYIFTYVKYVLVFGVEYVGLYYVCKILPLHPSFISIMLKGILCFGVVMVANIIIFRKKEEFSYLKNKLLRK